MNTQGMTAKGDNVAPWIRGYDLKEITPMPVVKLSVFTPEEKEELKELIREVYMELLHVKTPSHIDIHLQPISTPLEAI